MNNQTSNKYHLSLESETGDIKTHVTTDHFEAFHDKRSELIGRLKPGDELDCYQSNDEYAQFNLLIIGCDKNGLPFEYITRGEKVFKSYQNIYSYVDDEDWLGVFESRLNDISYGFTRPEVAQ